MSSPTAMIITTGGPATMLRHTAIVNIMNTSITREKDVKEGSRAGADMGGCNTGLRLPTV